jgi:hypothetical protein
MKYNIMLGHIKTGIMPKQEMQMQMQMPMQCNATHEKKTNQNISKKTSAMPRKLRVLIKPSKPESCPFHPVVPSQP